MDLRDVAGARPAENLPRLVDIYGEMLIAQEENDHLPLVGAHFRKNLFIIHDDHSPFRFYEPSGRHHATLPH